MAQLLFEALPTNRPPRESETRVLEEWRTRGIFQESLARTANGPPFVFYEGPPTANGMPHHGHVLTRVVKDLFPRYKTMDGFSVARKAGWDTHGLPVEVEVEKAIGSKRKQDIEAYGVGPFIEECKKSVWKYKAEWERLTERIGFWLDLERPYVTYDPEYVESVWWALKTIHQKGLLNKRYKILHWCPICQTGLSNAEVGQAQQEVKDPALTVAFETEPGTSFLAWTTTPWTLLSNVALVVGPEVEYGLYELEDGRRWWLAAARAEAYKKELGKARLLEKKLGRDLAGKSYKPLFDFHGKLDKRAHVVVTGDFVSTQDGTGIVHAAPAFGEDDYQVCRQNDLAFVQLVQADGTVAPECGRYAGKWFKDADPEIARELKERKLVVRHDQYVHNYPHCWRTGNPLMFFARSAWFIDTTAVKDRLVEVNRTITWAPEHIRDGRFGQFLEENRDWNLSRERYWATPLPLWLCGKCQKQVAVGSRAELVQLGATIDGKKVANPAEIEPHRPHVDRVKLPCSCGGTLERDLSVIDCWFDSGAMPFAQWGYPHVPGSKEVFAKYFPASFISEAIDQTRGWFYTLHAISTLLFGRAAYERCLVLGHVMTRVLRCKACSAEHAADAEKKLEKCPKCGKGPLEVKTKKLSKKDKNYTPPQQVLDEHGADAFRWFFYTSMTPGQPAVWEENGVRDARRTFLLKTLNVYQFFQEYASLDGFDPRKGGTAFVPIEKRPALDRWVVSVTHTTTAKVRAALDAYDFHAAAAALADFVDGLSNWYVRRSRDRAWSAAAPGNLEKWGLWWTLHETLVTLAKLTAPFTPFQADELHRVLVRQLGTGEASVHLERYPRVDEARIDRALEAAMDLARRTAALGKRARLDAKLKVRQPLRRAVVLLGSRDDAARLESMRSVVAEELNVKSVEVSDAYDRYVTFDVFPDWKTVGKRLGKRFRGKEGQEVLNAALRAAGARGVAESVRAGKAVTVTPSDGEGPVSLEPGEVLVRLEAKPGFVAAQEHEVVLVLDTALDEALESEYLAAELKSTVQKLRKDRKLAYDARIRVAWWTASAAFEGRVAAALERHGEWFRGETLATGVQKLPDAGPLAARADANPDDPVAQWCDLGEDAKVLMSVEDSPA